MKSFKAILLIASLIALCTQCLVFATGISPVMFKNVNQCFKKGFEYNSPIFGSIALSTGLIENLRFYGIETRAYKVDGSRDYIKDKAFADDYVIQMILILFPSPAGQLATQTEGINLAGKSTSFGKLCEKDSTAAATLINFAHAVRDWFKNKKSSDKLPNTADKIIEKVGQKDVIKSKFPTDTFKPTELNKLLTAIAKAVELEIALPKKSFKPAFYPRYFVEQIITAFLCYSFATQEDLKLFLGALSDDIIDTSKINLIDRQIKEDDVAPAIAKLDDSAVVTLDDVWMILSRNIFGSTLPYENRKNPISNASAQMYQRSSNTLSNQTFADCIEVALRHITNFMLYEKISDSFKLDFLKTHMQDKNNPYIQRLYDFYDVQKPSAANAGDPTIRSAWNKVVADLNAHQDSQIIYRQKFHSSDVKNNNELDTGMMNVVRVFNILCSLELPQEPKYVQDKDDDFKENVQQWVQNGLTKFFEILNPEFKSSIAFDNVSIQKSDLIGNINIVIKDSSDAFLFSFTIRVLSMHIDIQNMNMLEKNEFGLTSKNSNVMKNIIKAKGASDTIVSSLFLLDSSLKSDENLNFFCPLYQLFFEILNDANSMIRALNRLYDALIKKVMHEQQATIMLSNILSNFPWSDKQSLKELNKATVINQLKQLNIQAITNTVVKEVRGVFLQDDNDILLLSEHIQFIFSDSPYLQEVTISGPTENLEMIDFSFGGIKKLKILFCPKLKSLDVSHTDDLDELIFSGPMENLENIDISSGKIKKLELPLCPKLKELDLSYTDDLEELIFSGLMESLEVINLSGSGIKKLELSLCPKLKKLDLSNTDDLEELIFSGLMESLEEIDLTNSGIKRLALPLCPKLNNLHLFVTESLEEVTFSGPMESLEEIDLAGSEIKKLELPLSPKLEKISLAETENLEEITFSGLMESLEAIDLQDSKIKKIVGINFCPKIDKSKIPEGIKLIEIVQPVKDQLSEKLSLLHAALKKLREKLNNLRLNLGALKKSF